MRVFDPLAYGPEFAPLVDVERRRTLDAGMPNEIERDRLCRLTAKAAFVHATRAVTERDMAACAICGVWLLHDFLDDSHQISQSIKTDTGSFWHGIMHRREGDYSNAKYWFRHVGEHPVFEQLAQRAAELAVECGQQDALERLAPHGTWNPYALVDLCQSAVQGGDLLELCAEIQQVEWELLFDYSYHSAIDR